MSYVKKNLDNHKMNAYIEKAAQLLRQGKLVAFPTETVYGLGADASNRAAVNRVFAAKGRPADHPLIVHLASLSQLDEWAQNVSVDAIELARAFWPGPLTLILQKKSHVLPEVTGGQDTVGIRIPAHPIAMTLLRLFNGGVVAPSANQFTHVSPTTAAAVQEELGDKIDFILDGGECKVGIESTIIDMSGNEPIILRPGMISAQQIAKVLQRESVAIKQSSTTRVPGMHAVHYAPTTPAELVDTQRIPALLQHKEYAFITHTVFDAPSDVTIKNLTKDPVHYAHDLYRTLRELDHLPIKKIIIENVPNTPDWEAIRDRLTKATSALTV